MVVMVVKIVVVLAMGLRLVLILVLSAMTKLSLPYQRTISQSSLNDISAIS